VESSFIPDESAAESRYRMHRNELSNPGYLAYLRKLATHVERGIPKGSCGLDFGCGPTSGMEHVLNQYDFKVVSYDPIFAARKELLKRSYDFIICSEVVEHFVNPICEFERLFDLLNRDGTLIIRTQFVPESVTFSEWWYTRDITNVSYYTGDTMRWIGARFGAAIEYRAKDIVYLRRHES
jgi:2-polyprenyl-3-methyl-5-hydroxy-6-metoxy-1,4-benzoquinol methylase